MPTATKTTIPIPRNEKLEDFLKQKEDWRLKIIPDMQRNITDYAPHSFQAGYIDGAKWILKQLQQQTLIQ